MGLFRKVTAAATGLWGPHSPQSRGATSSPRPRTPATETPLTLRARHAPPATGATATPEPAVAPLEERVSKGLQAMEQRRLAALDQLKQVSAEWTQVQQARAAAAQPAPGRPKAAEHPLGGWHPVPRCRVPTSQPAPDAPAQPQHRPTLAQLFKEQDARDAAEKALTPGPQPPPARKTVRFATQAEVRLTGSYGSLAGPGRPVDLDPATGRPLGKDPVRDPAPRTAPARPAARPAQSEPRPSTAPAATAPSLSQPLSADERLWLAQALPGEGSALRRLADRAARAELAVSTGLRARATRLVSPGAPRPLDGQRRQEFRELLGQDITTLAQHAQIDEPSAAALLRRAVITGALGTATLPDDRLLLLGLLDRQAPPEPAMDVPWAKEALGNWWPTLPAAHQKAIEHAFEEDKDPIGAIWLAEAQAGGAEAAQVLHDHLFEHYRFENGDRLHRIQPTDTGRARNHLGVMTQAAQPSAGGASADDARDATLQAELERIYAANDVAKRQHRFLHGGPQPPESADPQRAGPSSPG